MKAHAFELAAGPILPGRPWNFRRGGIRYSVNRGKELVVSIAPIEIVNRRRF